MRIYVLWGIALSIMLCADAELSYIFAASSPPSMKEPSQRLHVYEFNFENLWNAVLQRIERSNGIVILQNKQIGLVTFYFYTAPALQRSSFRNISTFLKNLRARDEPVSQYLYQNLSTQLQTDLDKYDVDQYPSESLQTELFFNLNKIIYHTAIYEEVRFAGIQLRDSTKDLISSNLSKEDLPKLNRMLLEDAFPNQIMKNPSLTEPKSSSNVYCTVYIQHTNDTNKNVIYFSSWIAGTPTLANIDHAFFEKLTEELEK